MSENRVLRTLNTLVVNPHWFVDAIVILRSCERISERSFHWRNYRIISSEWGKMDDEHNSAVENDGEVSQTESLDQNTTNVRPYPSYDSSAWLGSGSSFKTTQYSPVSGFMGHYLPNPYYYCQSAYHTGMLPVYSPIDFHHHVLKQQFLRKLYYQGTQSLSDVSQNHALNEFSSSDMSPHANAAEADFSFNQLSFPFEEMNCLQSIKQEKMDESDTAPWSTLLRSVVESSKQIQQLNRGVEDTEVKSELNDFDERLSVEIKSETDECYEEGTESNFSADEKYSTNEDFSKKEIEIPIKMGSVVDKGVVRAAKTLFSKRTRTLCHWLYPDKSKRRLKATVSGAWDTLPEEEKNVYIAQVLGRFGNQSTALMVNPQLDGLSRYTHEVSLEDKKHFKAKYASEVDDSRTAVEKRQVEEMLAEYDSTDVWIHYPRRQEVRDSNGRRKWRTVCRRDRGPNAMFSQSASPLWDEDLHWLRLTYEEHKSRMEAHSNGDDIAGRESPGKEDDAAPSSKDEDDNTHTV